MRDPLFDVAPADWKVSGEKAAEASFFLSWETWVGEDIDFFGRMSRGLDKKKISLFCEAM